MAEAALILSSVLILVRLNEFRKPIWNRKNDISIFTYPFCPEKIDSEEWLKDYWNHCYDAGLIKNHTRQSF